MSLPHNIKVGDRVEVTHHMTFNRKWFPATVTKVTAHFVDVLRDDWKTSKPTRYRKATGREVSGYCGFFSDVRMAAKTEPTERSCRYGARPVDEPCEVCDAG